MIPEAIHKRIARMAVILLGAIIFGVIYALASHDRILLLLTLSLAVAGGLKTLFLVRAVQKREYVTMEGSLLSVRRNHIRKCQFLVIADDAGKETEISVKGRTALAVGKRYRLYLSPVNPLTGQIPQEAGFLGTGRTLLGYEEIS